MKPLILLAFTLAFGSSIQAQITTASIAIQQPLDFITQPDSLYTYQSYINGKWGVKNKQGRIVLSARYESIGAIHDYKFPVIINGYHGIADTNGKITWLKKYTFSTIHWEPSGETFIQGSGGGYIAVKDKNEKTGFINYDGMLIIPCKYLAVEPFSEGLSCVSKDSLFGFIDVTGKTVIPFYYKSAHSFQNDRAAVLINNKYGFIDKTGKVVIPARFEHTWCFSEGLCLVTKSANYTDFYFIDTNGKTVLKGKYDDAEKFTHGKAVILQNGKCWQIDKTGKKLKYMGTDYFQGC